jgi:hypothetical protein
VSKKDVKVRDSKGRFPKGTSGNPAGRPAGSKNKITLLKRMVEEAAREDNKEKMYAVIARIIDQALDGDAQSQKLVWSSIMSSAGSDDDKAVGARPQIVINAAGAPQAPKAEVVEEGEIIEGESSRGEEESVQ